MHVKKSLLSQAACDVYLAQLCPPAGAGKQTDGTGPHTALIAADAVGSRADVSYLPYRSFLTLSISEFPCNLQGQK